MRFNGVDIRDVHRAVSVEKEIPPGMQEMTIETAQGWDGETFVGRTMGRGSYVVRVGSSCEDIRLEGTVTVESSGDANPYVGNSLPHYVSGQVQDVPEVEFSAILGRPILEEKVAIDRNMTLGEIGHGRSPLGWLIHVIHKHLLDKSLKAGNPDLNLLFNYNMPLRAIAKMTGGMVSMGMVDGLVMELKGFWIIGILRVLFELVRNMVLNSFMEKRIAEKKESK